MSTSAARDGDDWVINGQKVWNTSAHHADFGLLLARSDSEVPKHRGLTYFALPMHQPGVEVRPLRQMNFHASFNEVFLTGARVPADNVVGPEGGGWAVALTTLAYERRFGAMRPPAYDPRPGRALDEARAESAAHFAVYSWYPQRAGRVDLVIEHAKAAGVADDPVIRQAIAHLITLQRVSGWTADRARAARERGAPAGRRGLGRQARAQQPRPRGRGGALDDRAGQRAADRARLPHGRGDRRGAAVRARPVDRRRHRRDPEEHPGREGARPAAEIRVDKDIPFSQIRSRG